MYLDQGCVISHQLQKVNGKSSEMIIFFHLLNLIDTKCPKKKRIDDNILEASEPSVLQF